MTDISPLELNYLLGMAEEIARNSGEILKKYMGRLDQISHKESTIDLVTEADKQSERLIIDFLKANFPGHAIISEEFGTYTIEGSNYYWVVDPLDGTTNYAHQNPNVAISIGLLFKKKPVLGIVYNPFYDELFRAAHGLGATLNGNKISVSKIKTLDKSLLATGFPYDRCENPDNNYTEFCHLTHVTHGVRRMGAASLDLAYVASGRFDGYWEKGIKQWDIAAGIVLVEEAGGKVSSYDGSPINLISGNILATNELIHEALSNELMRVKK